MEMRRSCRPSWVRTKKDVSQHAATWEIVYPINLCSSKGRMIGLKIVRSSGPSVMYAGPNWPFVPSPQPQTSIRLVKVRESFAQESNASVWLPPPTIEMMAGDSPKCDSRPANLHGVKVYASRESPVASCPLPLEPAA